LVGTAKPEDVELLLAEDDAAAAMLLPAAEAEDSTEETAAEAEDSIDATAEEREADAVIYANKEQDSSAGSLARDRISTKKKK
jgi:hypothetical protein